LGKQGSQAIYQGIGEILNWLDATNVLPSVASNLQHLHGGTKDRA
jgi:hypothetical protein